MRFWSTTRHWGAIIIQIINANRLTCLLFTLPPLPEHRDQSDRCGAWWHRSDSRLLSPGSRGSSWGFTQACAVPVSPGRKLMLAGNQVWWELSPTSSTLPPHPVPPTACVRAASWLWEVSLQLSSLGQRKSLTHLGLVCSGVPKARQSREICASTSMAHASNLQSWEPGKAGREKCGNPIPSSHLCSGRSLGFYLDSSPSMLNWPCVWGATILPPPPPLLPVCQDKHFWTLPGDQTSEVICLQSAPVNNKGIILKAHCFPKPIQSLVTMSSWLQAPKGIAGGKQDRSLHRWCHNIPVQSLHQIAALELFDCNKLYWSLSSSLFLGGQVKFRSACAQQLVLWVQAFIVQHISQKLKSPKTLKHVDSFLPAVVKCFNCFPLHIL